MQANPTNDCALVNCRSLMHTQLLYTASSIGLCIVPFVSFTLTLPLAHFWPSCIKPSHG